MLLIFFVLGILCVSCAVDPIASLDSTDPLVVPTRTLDAGIPDLPDASRQTLQPTTSELPPVRPQPRRWPARFAGGTPSQVLAAYARQYSLHDIAELSFYSDPNNPTTGMIVLRGVAKDGLFERGVMVRKQGRYFAFGHVVGRAALRREVSFARVADREANFDHIHRVHAECIAECAHDDLLSTYCRKECDQRAHFGLSVPDIVYADGDLRVTTSDRFYRTRDETDRMNFEIYWGGRRAYPISGERQLERGATFRRVTLAPSRTALYVRFSDPVGHRLFIPQGEGVEEVRGRAVHDYQAPIPWESWAGNRYGWSHPSSDEVLIFPGDGTIRRVFKEGSFCRESDRDGDNASWEWWRGRRSEIVLRLDRHAGRITSARIRRAPWGPCIEEHVAACPFVDLIDDSGVPHRIGEILRHVRYENRTQTLALPSEGLEVRHVRLSEEKNEITYLDAVHLEVNGRVVSPRSCMRSHGPRYCEPDGRPWVLEEGDMLDLTFDVGHVRSDDDVHLVATGHYRPLAPSYGAQ